MKQFSGQSFRFRAISKQLKTFAQTGKRMGERFFEILAPAQWVVPAVFNSPHSGSLLPQSFLNQSRLSAEALRQSEDCFVDELFMTCQGAGAPLLHSLVSRAYIDLNREPYELDARMFMENLPGHMNPGSPRVASGLGTIPRLVAEGEEIYRGRIHLSDALERIETIYRPYHRTLTALLNECYNATGFALLVDCHSMPSSAVKAGNTRSADIVLGDRFGAACSTEISQVMEELLSDAGFKVVRNRPYAGGFITETHGTPRHNRHALQIEINRALYMDETKLEKKTEFGEVQTLLAKIISDLLAYLPQDQGSEGQKAAAE
jgi:N-formylglutamate amidohydrolase